ncbi:MAG TPA: phosphotransferase [Naasia sp.]|jgi:hypothetical protein
MRLLPDVELLADLSWGVVDTVVLHVRSPSGEHIVKAAGPSNHHIAREITAHQTVTGVLALRGVAARLTGFDRALNIVITEYLPGRLVDGGPDELSPDVHEQAGALLRLLHSQDQRIDSDHERVATAKEIASLDQPHRISPALAGRARAILAAYRFRPVTLVPTHGDWQPRNWLLDGRTIKVIDFGRFEYRPAYTDLGRLATQQWQSAPDLEAAFLRGYGGDPREPEQWRAHLLRQAVSVAVWAHKVGDAEYEQQGLRMLDEAVALNA